MLILMVWGASMLRIHASFEKSPLVHEINLGKSWACKHWNFQKIFCHFFACVLHFFLHLGLSFWIYVVVFFGHFVSFFVMFFGHLFCHFFVICLSLFVILGTGKWKKKSLKHDYHDRPFTLWQHQIQGTGCLPWEIRFWACLDEELSPGPGCRAGSKTGWGGRGRGEMAGRGRLRPEKRGRPGNSKNATLPARESCFLHFFAFSLPFFAFFFAFPRLGVIFLAFFLHFPDWESFFLHFFLHFPNRESFFAFFLAFPRPGLPPSPLA